MKMLPQTALRRARPGSGLAPVFARILAPVFASLLALAVFPAAAETHAVVVGINHYLDLKQLRGAVADATDIAQALKKAGVSDLTTLIDQDATRASVLGAIDRMIATAKKDDLVIITFAGHGGAEVWGSVHPPGAKPGERHEAFLLTNLTLPNADGRINPKPGSSGSERIFGVEMALRLKRLDAKGVRSIFVADTCHGGGLTRQPVFTGSPEAEVSYRFAPGIYGYAEGVDPLLSEIAHLPASIDTNKELHLNTFLAAVDRDNKAPEVEIPKGSGTIRGALSYAFARVIEGAALKPGHNELSHGDVLSYVLASIKNNTRDNGRGQIPDLRPRENFDRVALHFGSDLNGGAGAVTNEKVISRIRIFTENGDAVAAIERPRRGFAIEAAPSRAEADLIFDHSTGNVFSRGGDLISMPPPPVDLAGVAEREVAIRRLEELAKTRSRPLELNQGDKRYRAGDILVLDARKKNGAAGPNEYYALIIIAGNGKVQFQYPLDTDPSTLPADHPFDGMQAGEPFGADYAVFISDSQPLDALIAGLRQLNGQTSPNAAVDLIERSLTPSTQIGLQAMYTAPQSK